jgi:hypothetical protein
MFFSLQKFRRNLLHWKDKPHPAVYAGKEDMFGSVVLIHDPDDAEEAKLGIFHEHHVLPWNDEVASVVRLFTRTQRADKWSGYHAVEFRIILQISMTHDCDVFRALAVLLGGVGFPLPDGNGRNVFFQVSSPYSLNKIHTDPSIGGPVRYFYTITHKLYFCKYYPTRFTSCSSTIPVFSLTFSCMDLANSSISSAFALP